MIGHMFTDSYMMGWKACKRVNYNFKNIYIKPLPWEISWALSFVYIRWSRPPLGKIVYRHGIESDHTTCAQGTEADLKFYM